MSKKGSGMILLAMLVLVATVIFALLLAPWKSKHKNQVIVGYISTGTIKDTGWNGTNIKGIRSICNKMGIMLIVRENVKEGSGECEEAAEELISTGASIVFLNSYSYMDEIGSVIEDNQDVAFYVNHVKEVGKDNVSSYFIRMYQARFLSGIVAGMKTKTDKIGYVAAMDTSEVNRGINAFTLGVRSVNPDAQVVVKWTGTWDDEQIEKEAVYQLVEEAGIDVVTYHQNRSHVIDAAEEKGIYSIGYLQEYEGYSPKYLTSVMGDWELIYRDILKECIQGKANSRRHYWIGLEKDAVFLSTFSDEVTEDIRQKVQEASEKMKTSQNVFSGEIYDNQGVLRCRENENISDKVLLEDFDWFVEGVSFLE